MKKYTFITLLLIAALAGFPFHPNQAAAKVILSDNTRLKQTALSVLTQKCNVCHKTYNPGKVFTADNMETLAPKIYKQVFVKRRMPKGRDIKLTPEEEQLLRQWLETKVPGIAG
jgi:uncharacterized membrane protein